MKDFLNFQYGEKWQILILQKLIFFPLSKNVFDILSLESLKCYLVGNRKCFTSISIDGLAEKFELPIKNVKKLVCKWIYNKDLKGSISSEGYLQIAQKKRS